MTSYKVYTPPVWNTLKEAEAILFPTLPTKYARCYSRKHKTLSKSTVSEYFPNLLLSKLRMI